MADIFSDGSGSDFEAAAVKPKIKKVASKPATTKAASKPKAAPKATTAKKQTALKTTKPSSKKRPAESDDENSEDDSLSFGDASVVSTTPPKKQKKAPAPKKSSNKPLATIANESFAGDDMATPKSAKKASNSDKYQKLTQLEHILKRPDTYIGSVERTDQQMWVFNSQTESMESREVSFVPGLYKIFDEILVNAADNRTRDKNMNEIRVWIDREKGEIAVRNNGRGIPIEMHAKEQIYIPEMIFGHLLTGSNYDDNEDKITGGRNGYGAKLCNVFSTQFTLETVDSKTKQKYKQTWRNNMGKMEKADIIQKYKGDDYTKVTFRPDFAKFGMSEIDDDFEALVKRRVYDMAATCSGVKVYLNDERIKISKFKQYMEMHTKAIRSGALAGAEIPMAASEQIIVTEKQDERWEIGCAVSDGSFQQVSFVNSIATTSGGTHVNYIADQIINKIAEVVKKRKDKGGVVLKNAQIKNHMFLFVNCAIVNPAFTSQTKEQLTTKASQFGSKCTVSDKFLKAIEKTDIIDNILAFARKKGDLLLKKSDGSKRARMNNSKLTDANKAGTKDGYKCTLILTEGDSASLLALAGRAVVNPDHFGVFPLRGKLLNVRDASVDQISKNQEIQNIKKFMGLQHKREYTDTTSLRYGHLMIMTDQDHDGSHIKGLLINFLQCQFPSLLKMPGFLLEFITPIVKVWKGNPKNPTQKRDFFTMPEYEAWKLQPGHEKGWEHKYFKGLGTSNTSDAEEYFADLDKHLKEFHTIQEHENQLLDLAFSKKKADDRKIWLQNFVPGTYLDMSGKEAITYDDFINKELILFSMADNQRSIPSVVDGFKPGQRKVLYTCFQRKIVKDVKVVELAGLVSGLTHYSYGETSLQGTIVGLAQDFVGSNNINTLEPSGNFGSRLQGGNDAASARYIYTRLSPFARRIFHASDDALLTYNTDDGKNIEPVNYMPVVPMILVNGADGIGTGWSTSIPNYSPVDIVENLKIRMRGSKDDMKAMTPWFRSWTGQTEDTGNSRFKFTGTITLNPAKCEIEITELPVRLWTQDFKERLEAILSSDKGPSPIKDYTEYNTPNKIHFIIKMHEKDFQVYGQSVTAVEDYFKLTKSMATTNLVAFDSQGRIHKYESPLDIMEEFYIVRLDAYAQRKRYLLGKLDSELDKFTNQARFVQMIIDGKLVVSKKKKAVLIAELQKLDFKRIPKLADAKKAGETEDVLEDQNTDDDSVPGSGDFNYLLGMAIWSLTQERVEQLMKQIGEKKAEISTLAAKSEKHLWNEDLDALLEEWETQLNEEAVRIKKARSKGRRASAKLGIGAKNKKRKADDTDDDSDFDLGAKKKKPNALARAVHGEASMQSWLANKDKKPAANLNIDGSPLSQPPAVQQGLIKPKTTSSATAALKGMTKSKPIPVKDEDQDVVMQDVVKIEDDTGIPTTRPAKSSRAGATKKKYTVPSDAEDSDEEFHDVEEIISKPAPVPRASSKAPEAVKPTARAAVQQRKKYAESSDDDSMFTDKNLGDISMMVKGTGPATAGRPLLTTSSARPSSAHGLAHKPSALSLKKGNSSSDRDVDDTDWGKLIGSSPRKPRETDRDVAMLDEEDESLLLSSPKKKPLVKTSSTSAAALAKKKNPAVVVTTSSVLSPAAKAYKKKLEKQLAAAQAAGKRQTTDDDELADELLDDSLESVKPKKKGTATKASTVPAKKASAAAAAAAAAAAPFARPARRTATNKRKIVLDEDSEEESSASEASYDDDDDDSE